MRPLAQFPRDTLRQIDGVLTDIDDTLTTGGKLTAAAYAAMERLRDAGVLVIPITGRPAALRACIEYELRCRTVMLNSSGPSMWRN